MNKLLYAWVLVDEKVGSNNQAIALASSIGCEFEKVELKYNVLAKIPNYLLPYSFWQLKAPNINFLLQKRSPDIIISASRKSGLVSAAIKRCNPRIKNIHIHNPCINRPVFDLVILPQHDINILPKGQKVYRTIGALNNIKQKINDTYADYIKYHSNLLGKKYIAVLIGGSTKNFSFNTLAAKQLKQELETAYSVHNLPYFITYSRRTPESVKNEINDLYKQGHEIFDPASKLSNPYPAFLRDAVSVFSTCDSIAMLSEVVSLGKPLYIYIPDDFKSAKHLAFITQLQDLNMTKIYNSTRNSLQEYNYSNLSESNKAAEYVLSEILGVK